EDGIRDKLVTGVQTCALPICGLDRTVSVLRRTASIRRRSASTARSAAALAPHALPTAPTLSRMSASEWGSRFRTAGREARDLTRSEERRVGKEGRWK